MKLLPQHTKTSIDFVVATVFEVAKDTLVITELISLTDEMIDCAIKGKPVAHLVKSQDELIQLLCTDIKDLNNKIEKYLA